jgi:hypothetical protein
MIWIGAYGCVAFTLSFTEFVPESDLKIVAVTRRGNRTVSFRQYTGFLSVLVNETSKRTHVFMF